MPILSEKTWHDNLSEVIKSGVPLNLKPNEKGVVIWKTAADDTVRSEIVFDLARGANVTLFELAPQSFKGNAVPGFRCTYTWTEDGIGGFRLKKLVVAQFRQAVSDPERLIEIEILAFNPKPQFPTARFTRDAIRLPMGTEVATFDAVPGSHPKVSQIGGPVKRRLTDKELEDLAKGLKDQGFSNPSRNTKPR